MTSPKTGAGETFGAILVVAVFVALFTPYLLFEANAHSGVTTQYTVTKTGWMMYSVPTSDYRYIQIRDRATGRMVGNHRGLSYSAHLDEFFAKSVPTDLAKGRRYEFQLRCTKVGTLLDPMASDVCEIVSLREIKGA
jgi:hypothetical protein